MTDDLDELRRRNVHNLHANARINKNNATAGAIQIQATMQMMMIWIIYIRYSINENTTMRKEMCCRLSLENVQCGAYRLSTGSKFQAKGQAHAESPYTNLDSIHLCTKSCLSAERRVERLSFVDKIHSSLRYTGATCPRCEEVFLMGSRHSLRGTVWQRTIPGSKCRRH